MSKETKKPTVKSAVEGTKRNQEKHARGKKRGDVDEKLKEQVAALGGDKSDLELLKGVRDEGLLETGDQGNDVKLTKDVSKFLANMNLGDVEKSTSEKQSKKTKKKEKVENSEKPETVSQKREPKTRALDKSKSEPKSHKKKVRIEEPKPLASSDEEQKKSIPLLTAPLPRSSSKLIFPPSAHWYSATTPLPPPTTPLSPPTSAQVSSLSTRASTLLEKDTTAYQAASASTGHSASDSHFLNTILTKGTLSDRLSALTLLVQASPIHNMKALETLKSMAERGRCKGGREEGLKAMRCVVDWWVGGGAPGRKLRYLRDQPFLLHPQAMDQHLIAWYFEDWLKKYFFSILQILETYSLDNLAYVRTQCLSFLLTLLRDKPEQEQNLLRLLVNKLGDTEKSVCSRASYHILQLLQAHPNMKSIVVREIRSLIFRPTASSAMQAQASSSSSSSKPNTHIRFDDTTTKDKAKKSRAEGKSKESSGGSGSMEKWNTHAWYYASVTLNQIVLTSTELDREVARDLIDVYFEMFKEVLGNGGSAAATSAVGEDDEDHSKNDDKNKGTPHQKKSKKNGKQKETRGAAGFAEVEDANSRLISAILTGVNRALPFAKLGETGGEEGGRSGGDVLRDHLDTLFLITHTSTFNISIQALVLILQVISSLSLSPPTASSDKEADISTPLRDRYYRTLYSSLIDPRLSKSSKQAMYLNLVFKSLKADTNLERVKAFVRRFVQVLVMSLGGSGGMEFVAGGLYVIGELFSTIPGLRDMLSFSTSTSEEEGDHEPYDPKKRDPQYAHASSSPLYELIPLLHHYHPTISLHASQLLHSKPLTATPDLSLNTLSHFLDRFVYKNPKQKLKPKGASAMQPSASDFTEGGVKLVKGEVMSGKGMVPVNDESWWKGKGKREEEVPADEVFFWKFFKRKEEMEREQVKKNKKRRGAGDDGESDDSIEEDDGEEGESEIGGGEDIGDEDEEPDSDADEAEIWKAMKSTMPAELQDDGLMDESDEEDGDLPWDLGSDDDSDLPDHFDDDEAEDEAADVDGSAVGDSDDNEEDADSFEGGLIEFPGSASEDEEDQDQEWGGFGGEAKKRKRGGEEGESGKAGKRKKLKSLPTFASYEDYAKLIEDGPEDNL